MAEENLHKEHRKRLRHRYELTGLSSFEPHVVLELLLFNSIRRADTNPTAHRLVNRFGSLYHVMTATEKELRSVKGVGPTSAQMIKCTWDIMREAELRGLAESKLDTYEKLYMYATIWYSGKPDETVAMLLLDDKYVPIDMVQIASEHMHEPADFVEKMIEVCEKYKAHQFVLIHNHADGYMEASGSDIYLTQKWYTSLLDKGIQILEHLILHEFNCMPILDYCMQKKVSPYVYNHDGRLRFYAKEKFPLQE